MWTCVNCLCLGVVLSQQPGKLLPSAHAVEREYQVMKAIEGHGVPVPKMLCLCEDNRWRNSKVITTMVIRPIDWRPHMMCSICFRRFATPRFGVRRGRGWAHSIARLWIPISFLLTHMVYLLPFLSYCVGSKSVSVCPTQYAVKYRSRSCRFVERQKCIAILFGSDWWGSERRTDWMNYAK